jgi:predicted  nucleic acid-binding Zn-ribbon protein
MQRHKEALEIHRRELSGQLKYLGAELADLEARRVALVADIPVDAEAQYQLLRKQKGKAVAKVEQGSCRGCGISVTAAWLHRARAGEIVRCTNCNRILHME